MKKTTLSIFMLLVLLMQGFRSSAQHTFTADLQLLFRDTMHTFVIDPYDSVDIVFAITNHGPDNIDTSNFIVYSMTNVPPQYFLVIQTENGLPILNSGDTIDSYGPRFVNDAPGTQERVEDYCFFLRTSEDADSFIYDPNLSNDTICFRVVYKPTQQSSIGKVAQTHDLQMSPNPAKDMLNIPMSGLNGQAATVTVTGIDGRLVSTEQLSHAPANYTLQVGSWPRGIYVVTVQTDKVKTTGKLVLQ